MVYQKLCQNNCQGRDHWDHSTAPRLGLTAPEEVSFAAALAVPRCRAWPWVKKKTLAIWRCPKSWGYPK